MSAPEPFTASRTFNAPREAVYDAFSASAHARNWFPADACPSRDADVYFQTNGAFAFFIPLTDGRELWFRGRMIEIRRPDHVIFTGALSEASAPIFSTHTTLLFETRHASTILTVREVCSVGNPSQHAAELYSSESRWASAFEALETTLTRAMALESR